MSASAWIQKQPLPLLLLLLWLGKSRVGSEEVGVAVRVDIQRL